MPAVVRMDDTGSGHGAYGDTVVDLASTDTIVNGKGVHRVGDTLVSHADHGRSSAEGSTDVIVNGMGAVRVGDPVDCGGMHVDGSDDVMVN